MIQELSAKELDSFIEENDERAYLIVDIRKPEEYRLAHIPGAINIQVTEIETSAASIFNDRKIIFCCTSGKRSKVGVFFAMDAGYDEKKLFNLQGGMMTYAGEILLDLPRLDIFPPGENVVEVMKQAIDLEKGALIFYSLVKKNFADTPIFNVLEKMEHSERAHARNIYNQLQEIVPNIQSFDALFEACNGGILEGGKPLSEIQEFISGSTLKDCANIMDFAIELEFSAYDLYRAMAENLHDRPLKDLFYSLAQAEKKHLNLIIHSSRWCDTLS